jgi:NAD(P)-dependent dehydrogenase (short-subunit alcohol dehydrogenase family)
MGSLLEDKIAVITGAARGMGEATARLFSREGAAVCLWDTRPLVHDVVASISSDGGEASGFELDISDSSSTEKAAQEVLAKHRRIDVLVNCAGIGMNTMFLEMDDQLRDRVLGVNLIGTANCCKAVLPSMVERRSGRIVNISSVTGPITAIAGGSAYAASKGAVSALTKALAVEMGPHGITVNAVLPGTVATPLLAEFFREQGLDPDDVYAKFDRAIPLRRIGKPEDIAGACLILASDYASYISGAELVVDGAFNLPEWEATLSD